MASSVFRKIPAALVTAGRPACCAERVFSGGGRSLTFVRQVTHFGFTHTARLMLSRTFVRQMRITEGMGHTSDCTCPPCRYRRGEDLGQAPRLTVRLRPDVRDFLLGHGEGARGLIERLVDQERQARPADRARIKDLEKQVALLQEQLPAVQSGGGSAGRKEHLSDDSSGTAVAPLDLYATRFRENFRKHFQAKSLARRLGLKKEEQRNALGLGYCGTRGVARDSAEQKELKKLEMVERNGRERLAGCLTVPIFTNTGKLSGFWGCALKTLVERCTGTSQGLLATGPLGEELVLVDGVVEALAAFAAGISGVQAAELLTPSWLPALRQAGVRKVWLALSLPEQTKRMAAELTRLGMECWLVEVPENRESRVDLLEYSPGWKLALKKARRYEQERNPVKKR